MSDYRKKRNRLGTESTTIEPPRDTQHIVLSCLAYDHKAACARGRDHSDKIEVTRTVYVHSEPHVN